MQGSTRIPPLFWFVRPHRQEFVIQEMQGGARLFPFFSSEARALDYQQAHGLGGDWAVWGNDTAEYVLEVLDAAGAGFDVYAIDPPVEMGAWFQAYTLEEMKGLIRRKAREGGGW